MLSLLTEDVGLDGQIPLRTYRTGSEKTPGQVPWHPLNLLGGSWRTLLVHPEVRESPVCHLRGKTKAQIMAKCTIAFVLRQGWPTRGNSSRRRYLHFEQRQGNSRSLQPWTVFEPGLGDERLHITIPWRNALSIYEMAAHKGRKNFYPFKFQETVDAFCFEKQSNSTGKISAITL